MAVELMPGANVALPDRTLGVVLPGPFDLSAVVLGAGGRVAGAATIRAWAHANGHIVGPRGRLPRHVQDAFRAVHGHQ